MGFIEKFSESDLIYFLVSIAVILMSSTLMEIISRKFKLTKLVAYLLTGIVLGPTVLGKLYPNIQNTLYFGSHNFKMLEAIFNLSTLMLLFIAGSEIKISSIRTHITPVISITMFGTIIPFLVGYNIAFHYPQLFLQEHSDSIFSLFIGTGLSVSALPVIAIILTDVKIIQTKLGTIILTSAMLTDIIGWTLFSYVLTLHKFKNIDILFVKELSTNLIILFLIVLCIATIIYKIIIPMLNKESESKELKNTFNVLPIIICIVLSLSAFSQYIELHASLGAFLSGIAIKKILEYNEEARKSIEYFIVNFFTPLFFVSIGLKVDFINSFNLNTTLILIVIASATKFMGAAIGGLIGKLDKVESLAVGVGMNARGAMEIILSSLALGYGIINSTLFVSFVIMSLVTSIISMQGLHALKMKRDDVVLIK